MTFTEHIKSTPQRELGEVLGLSRPLISAIQNDKRSLTESQEQLLREYFDDKDSMSQMRINIPQQRIEKFRQVLLYILNKVGAKPNIGQTALYKLLYFIDFDYYELHEEQLMGLTYIKNTFGPTPREFAKVVSDMKEDGQVEEYKSAHFSHQQKKYIPVVAPELSLLNGQELKVIDSVLNRYSDFSAKQLSDLSHEDTPWQMAEDKADINYEYAFYRPERFSVREYSDL